MKGEEIVRRFDALSAQRKTVEQTWDYIEKFIAPLRGGKFFQPQSSEHEIDWRRGRDVFDNTAMVACDILASSMHSALTSPALQWFGLRFEDEKLNTDVEAKRWLEEVGEMVYGALGDSNFNLEINETYLDLVSFGTAALVEEDLGDGELDFSAVPIRECHFEMGAKGGIHRFYRWLQWTPSQMVDKWGIEKLPQEIQDRYKNAQGVDTKEDIIFCIWDRANGADGDTVKAPALRRFGFKYVMKRGNIELGEEGGYYEMPVYLPRWKKASGSQWGFGPGTLALSDVLTLNYLIELVLKATEKVVDPATLAQERAILSDLDLGASGLTVVRDINGIKAYESQARFDVSALQVEDLRRKINRTFLVDQLEMKESPAMTATEVQVRYELMQRLLGPTLGRLQSDLLDPLVERTFRIMLRSGKVSQPPSVVTERKGQLDVEYVGPLARAQRIDRVASMERWVAQIGQLAQVMPDILDLPDPDALGRESARLLGVPSKVIRPDAQVKQLRDERKQAQAEARQLADAGAAAQAMAGVAATAKDLKAAAGT